MNRRQALLSAGITFATAIGVGIPLTSEKKDSNKDKSSYSQPIDSTQRKTDSFDDEVTGENMETFVKAELVSQDRIPSNINVDASMEILQSFASSSEPIRLQLRFRNKGSAQTFAFDRVRNYMSSTGESPSLWAVSPSIRDPSKRKAGDNPWDIDGMLTFESEMQGYRLQNGDFVTFEYLLWNPPENAEYFPKGRYHFAPELPSKNDSFRWGFDLSISRATVERE